MDNTKTKNGASAHNSRAANCYTNGLPEKIKIFDVTYTITYVDKPSEVDILERNLLFGQIDYWTRSIRIYKNDRTIEDIWQTIWHEVIHAICDRMKIDDLINEIEKVTDLLATGINLVINDNFNK